MQKELHIWMGENYYEHVDLDDLHITLEGTEMALNSGVDKIHTVQPHVCSTMWLLRGYRIFVHMLDGEIVEMKLGYVGDNLKEIRVAHNLEKMVLAGCFGKSTIE